ncbi:DUF6520 family protein [Salinimicrobium sp. MT39]|uniref:DUF6520 family protein n=1 Tax=Salinimicrobium profundisediminis TaxID=2994553 RepID=A0A9X3CYU3_9FLAO|nr:DUF6520 family protein [Salinimicrobium profundisediminis]MCX2839103.1 DUF6520 family protein [Salinimicrobium profundisediminis]
MKTNFLLPMIAMIFAIGMSFATDSVLIDPNQDYVRLDDGSFMPLGKEIDCGIGDSTCEVELPNGEIRPVYDASDPNTPKVGDGEVNQL